MKNKTLIIGYGNYDRQDDGVAWHILCGIAEKLGREIPDPYGEGFLPEGENPHLMFSLQLYPEMSHDFGQYEHICFVDAHTGAIPDDLQLIELDPYFETSPLTHHMTPQALLSLIQVVSGAAPKGILVSVRGYAFEFDYNLSEATALLAKQAIESIWQWLNE
ncbi:MAG: hypothetical protein JW750_02915 [Anaerolineaceae bacterium]|nr:hypothetical protein [Anaerolineaceae bacterium]